MDLRIVTYNCAWSLIKRQGYIKMRLEDDQIISYTFKDNEEFTAVLMILQGDDTPMYAKDIETIYTGTEIPGEV